LKGFFPSILLNCFSAEGTVMIKASDREVNSISSILTIIKISIVFFVVIIIYINIPDYLYIAKEKKAEQISLYNGIFFLVVATILYVTWSIFNRNTKRTNDIFRIGWVFENLFFIVIISIPVYLSKFHETEYKYLFLLLIIFSVIQYGIKYGVITSLLASFQVLAIDLVYYPIIENINIYFQKDLILVGVMIFVAWILGYYVDIEYENNKNKDKKLNSLSHMLKDQREKRMHIENLLLKNSVCYDILFENSVNSVLIHQNGKIIYANESAVKLLGYEKFEDMNDNFIYKHYPSEEIDKIRKKYSCICDEQKSKIISEEIILNCAGESIEVKNTSSFFIYDSKIAVISFLLDITPQKQIENLKHDVEENIKLLNESREFNTVITDFFINISHELKTPVNVIYSAIQGIDRFMDPFNLANSRKCKEYLNIMKQNCFRMIRLINNILDITKVDSGFMQLNKINDNIVEVIEEITQSVASYIKSKGVDLIFDTDVEEKNMAFDHDKIERIILNLLSNAFKYTPANGKICVDIHDKDDSVIISVKDTGEGIPENKFKEIFEKFGQVNKSLSRSYEGSGVGLYLVKSFVEMHGGKISVESMLGQGTKFTMILPVELLEEDTNLNKTFFESNVERIDIEFSDIYSISD
jgi:PAS domain S-box-containing protein